MQNKDFIERAAAVICERCAANGRDAVPATTRQEYRHATDHANWPNTITHRCDRCAQDLRDYVALPSIGMEILSEETL